MPGRRSALHSVSAERFEYVLPKIYERLRTRIHGKAT